MPSCPSPLLPIAAAVSVAVAIPLPGTGSCSPPAIVISSPVVSASLLLLMEQTSAAAIGMFSVAAVYIQPEKCLEEARRVLRRRGLLLLLEKGLPRNPAIRWAL